MDQTADVFSARVWGVNYGTELGLEETTEGLELTVDVGDQEATIVLDPHGVRNLRLALTRFERARGGA